MFSREEIRNLILAVCISAAILMLWQMPAKVENTTEQGEQPQKTYPTFLTREEALADSNRVRIDSDTLTGSIALTGLRFDDLLLKKYRQELAEDSPQVKLLSPSSTKQAYFAEFGWIGNTELPNKNTLWTADKGNLAANDTTTFRWENSAGVVFTVAVSLDEHYMFTITQNVENRGDKDIELFPYGLVRKNIELDIDGNMLDAGDARSGHKGFVGVFDEGLDEIKYSDLKEEIKTQSVHDQNGWFGFTDKYWFTAIIPPRDIEFTSKVAYLENEKLETGELDKYQADYLGEKQTVASGATMQSVSYFYAGAKEVSAIDTYSETLSIPLFDRAIDFGWFYFIAKPMFIVLHMLYMAIGNLGLAIIALTVFVKMLLFPIANASYKSMNKMKKVQPEVTRLKEMYANDKLRLNQETMQLYKKHKVNPAAGCFPLLIQIPIFFSLFKVLSISIEVRHAPFFGWIKDLSAPDPTSVFNLFNLIPWDPPQLLNIGVLPILWCISMIVQQRFNPPPSDPVQEKVMKGMPYFFLILFSSFPAGLVVYWICSNLITILQQSIIRRND